MLKLFLNKLLGNMGKYDTVGRCEEGLDLYYVHKLPNAVPKSGSSRWDVEKYEQEQLERQLYGRLQGHRGKVLPFLGHLCKFFFLIALFPFYCLIFIKKKLEQAWAVIYAKLYAIVTPPAMKVYRFYLKIKAYLSYIHALVNRGIQYFFEKRDAFFNKVFTYLKQLENKFVHLPKNWAVSTNKQFIQKKESISQRLLRKGRSYAAWVRVLSRYGMRVAEDWTLEMKRWFSLQ